MDFTKNEVKVLSILWRSPEPVTCRDLLCNCGESSWSEQTVHNIVNKLLKKGTIHVCGFYKCGKGRMRTFEPLLSCEDYLEALLTPAINMIDITTFINIIIDISNPDIQTINDILNRMLRLHNVEQ